MPRFAVSMERPCNETRKVVVEADDIDHAKVIALSADFDEDQLHDWEPMDPGDAVVYDVEEAADQPLTPLERTAQ
jgi:hypothetical protein